MYINNIWNFYSLAYDLNYVKVMQKLMCILFLLTNKVPTIMAPKKIITP